MQLHLTLSKLSTKVGCILFNIFSIWACQLYAVVTLGKNFQIRLSLTCLFMQNFKLIYGKTTSFPSHGSIEYLHHDVRILTLILLGSGGGDSVSAVGLFVITFDWVFQFCWNHLPFPKIYMEWLFRKKDFGVVRICGLGTTFLTDDRINILRGFKFPQIYIYYIYMYHIEQDFFQSNQFFCAYNMQREPLQPY